MSKTREIKEGDRILILFTIIRDDGMTLTCRLAGGTEHDIYTVPTDALFPTRRIPRALKVGDMVKWTKTCWSGAVSRWRIVAIDGDQAAVVGAPPNEIAHNWIPLSDLDPEG